MIRHMVTESQTWGPSTEFIFASRKSEAAALYRQGNWMGFGMMVIGHYFRKASLKIRLNKLASQDRVLLIHFQEIGVAWCRKFLKLRTKPTWIYVLDASFFCIRSYNHIPGELDACLRCLGGDYSNASKLDCKPFPIAHPESLELLGELETHVKAGRLRFMVQNKNHADLIRRHYGKNTVVEVIGLWTVDMYELADPVRQSSEESGYDVVFHAEAKEVKGFYWTLDLAKVCPGLSFLFPCAKPQGIEVPPNCHFIPMRWEGGLRDEVRKSRITLAPSLWSAPIEGALVKSVLHAPRVAVIELASAFSSELPESLVTHLGLDPTEAVKSLEQRLSAAPNDHDEIKTWFYETRAAARINQRISDAMDNIALGV